jgi:hypothetical protein
VHGDRERDAEDAARDFYARHGHWPDEAPPQGTAPPPEAHRAPRPDPHVHRPAGRPGSAPRRRPRRP